MKNVFGIPNWYLMSDVEEKYCNIVNSEIFARTLFSRKFAYAKFRENKTQAKWQNHSVVY